MIILAACEESQQVCKAFREKGHTAFSCDLQPCSGGHPEWHIQGDVVPLLNGYCSFTTMDGVRHSLPGKWDMIIASPPCTYLTITGNRWLNVERYGETAIKRQQDRKDAADFFMKMINADCERISVENPIGCMNTMYQKPTQIVEPYMFGVPRHKKTCLWLKGLKPLEPTNIVPVDESDYYSCVAANGKIKHDTHSRSKGKKDEWGKIRSVTPDGLAEAMADQWG